MEKTILVSLLGIVLSAVLMPTLAFAPHSSPFSSVASFQSKAAILDNIPSHNVTVVDINIAYKQIGRPDGKQLFSSQELVQLWICGTLCCWRS
jgi:hypothetical protein